MAVRETAVATLLILVYFASGGTDAVSVRSMVFGDHDSMDALAPEANMDAPLPPSAKAQHELCHKILERADLTLESTADEVCEGEEDRDLCELELKRYKVWQAPPCFDDERTPSHIEKKMHCWAPNLMNVLQARNSDGSDDADLMHLVRPGWTTTGHMTFALEKESSDIAILNGYRPEWVSKKNWRGLCTPGHPFCVGKCRKPCVPSGPIADAMAKEKDNLNLILTACTNHKTIGHAYNCLHAQKTKFEENKDLGRAERDGEAPEFDELARAYYIHARRLVLNHCVMANDSPWVHWTAKKIRWDSIEDDMKSCLKEHLGTKDAVKWLQEPYVHPSETLDAKAIEDKDFPTDQIFTDKFLEVVRGMKDEFKALNPALEYQPKQTWESFVRFGEAFSHLNDRLTQETAPDNWEVNHRKCENTLSHIMTQVAFIEMLFGNTRNLHMHVVFERPQSNCCDCPEEDCTRIRLESSPASKCQCNGYNPPKRKKKKTAPSKASREKHVDAYNMNQAIGAYAVQLNDFGALKAFHLNVHQPYLTVWSSSEVDDLKKILSWGGKPLSNIESMEDGHNWGTYKNAFIAIRAGIYGNPSLVGFEVRGATYPQLTDPQMKVMQQYRNIPEFTGFSEMEQAKTHPHDTTLFLLNIVRTLKNFRSAGDEAVSGPIRISVEKDSMGFQKASSFDITQMDKEDVKWGVEQAETFAKAMATETKPYNVQDLEVFQANEREVGFNKLGLTEDTPNYEKFCAGDFLKKKAKAKDIEDNVEAAFTVSCSLTEQKDVGRWDRAFRRSLGASSKYDGIFLGHYADNKVKLTLLGGVPNVGDEPTVEEMMETLRDGWATLKDSDPNARFISECPIDSEPVWKENEKEAPDAGEEEDAINPEGCIQFDGLYYPVPFVRFSMKVLKGADSTMAKECRPYKDFRTFVSRYMDPSILGHPERVASTCEEDCAKKAKTCIGDDCSESAGCEKDQCGNDLLFVKGSLPLCLQDMWTRWSFGVLLPRVWRDFLGLTEEQYPLEMALQGDTLEEQLDNLYTKFLEPSMMECNENKYIGKTGFNQCYNKFLKIIYEGRAHLYVRHHFEE